MARMMCVWGVDIELGNCENPGSRNGRKSIRTYSIGIDAEQGSPTAHGTTAVALRAGPGAG